MTAYRQLRVPGGTYFFTVRLAVEGGDGLLRNVDALRAAYAACVLRFPFQTRAIVILPDHLHAVWTLPEGDSRFARRWKLIKHEFSMNAVGVPAVRPDSRAQKHERGIWQHRFREHCIRDPGDLARHVSYCWTDPVRHGLCATPEDWAHSSLHRDKARANLDLSTLDLAPEGCFGE